MPLHRPGRLAILARSMVVCPRLVAREGSFARVLASAVALAIAAPPAAAMPPSSDPERQKVEAVFEAANRASEAGDHLTAAEKYAEAVALLPERKEHHEGRALALLDSVRARRRAFSASGDTGQLCVAREQITRYLDETNGAYGGAAAQMDGPRAAAREREEIEGTLTSTGETCSQGQVEGPTEPGPTTRPDPAVGAPKSRMSPLAIAGAATLGAAGGFFVMMAVGLGVGQAAEADGRDLRRTDPTRDIDGLLDSEFYRRGRAANGVAIAGGVLGGLAAAAGASLLVLGLRPRARPAVDARLGPGGVALRLRF